MNQIGQTNQPARPNNYLVLAIISIFFCCMPLSIVSIIYATKVNTAYDNGNYVLAESSSKNAKIWLFASIGVGIISIILVFVLVGFAGIAGAMNA